jgi:hypothetical protein
MLKSKTILLSVLIAFLGASLMAQTSLPAYYISPQGDTTKGTALMNAYSEMGKEIRFKSKNGENIILKPETTKAVWLSPDRYFESQAIHFRNATDELDGVYFLRYLSKTDSLTLMKFENGKKEGLYIQKIGEKITALQLLNDFVFERKDDFLKLEVNNTDTLSYAEQSNVGGSAGRYKTRKSYLFLLYKYFDFCDVNIMNSAYRLTEKDIKKAFQQSAKCLGRQNQIKNYFKESSWKLSVGVTIGSQIGSKDFNYQLPLGAGIFMNYSDLKDGLCVGVNWLNAQPKATAISPLNGSFTEFFANYNRKVFLREKFNFGTIIGIALLQGNGLSAQGRVQGTSIYFDAIPKEESFYSAIGVSGAYQFRRNNYLNIQVLRNILNIVKFETHFDRVQVQYEYRF